MFTTLSNERPVRRAWIVAGLLRAYGVAVLAGILLFTLAGDARAGVKAGWEDRVIVEAAIKSAVAARVGAGRGEGRCPAARGALQTDGSASWGSRPR